MKIFSILLLILVFNAFAKTKLYYYDKCDSSFSSIKEALISVGVTQISAMCIGNIAKLNSIENENLIYWDNWNYKLYIDPEVNDYLLNLLKKGKLISYVDNYLPIEEIKANFKNTDDFYGRKNSLIVMSEYLLENSNMKTPFIAALLAILDYTNNFGKIKYCEGKENYRGKIVTEIPLEELKKLEPQKCSIGCFEWEGEEAEELLKLYLEGSKGNDNLNIEQVTLAEAKMIVNNYLNNERRKKEYDNWNQIIEWRHPRYYDHSPEVYAKFFVDLYQVCDFRCPKTGQFEKIYQIMTKPQESSDEKNKIVKLKEKVFQLTKDLFGIEISFNDEMEAIVYLPYGKISIKIFDNIKIEKNGQIKYIIENNELKKIDLNYNKDKLNDILNKLKDAFKGKFQIISLKDINKKMEKSIDNANIIINYIFPFTLEYIVIFTSNLDYYTEYTSGVIYTITFNDNNLIEEIVKNLVKENIFAEFLIKALVFVKDGLKIFLDFLKTNSEAFSLLSIILAIIAVGLSIVTGGVFPVPIPI
jgi:hypothetical protein